MSIVMIDIDMIYVMQGASETSIQRGWIVGLLGSFGGLLKSVPGNEVSSFPQDSKAAAVFGFQTK